MTREIGILTLTALAMLSSCAKTENSEAGKSTGAAQTAGAPHAIVNLKDGGKVPGTIVASSQTDVVVAGDDGIERKIPLDRVKSVEYVEAGKAASTREAPQQTAPSTRAGNDGTASAPRRRPTQTEPAAAPAPPAPAPPQPVQQAAQPRPAEPPPPPPPTIRTYELPAASEVSVRTNEAIDSATAAEGQTFDAQVTRDVRDADGAVVIPRGSRARVVIKSASQGGRFRGASDLVLDLQSVVIGGRAYAIDTVDVSQKEKPGIGANKRTAEYTGGGAALGAIIGAIAGGGKGAAIGAGAGAGAGALTQILTKGGAIRVPPESVLTFRLDKPLKVSAVD